MNKKYYQLKKHIIIVCYSCLREVKIPLKEMVFSYPTVYKKAKKWEIPSLVEEREHGPFGFGEIAASSIFSYCPRCKKKKRKKK